MNVVVATPTWGLNGVNIFAANLVRGLQAEGVRACILLTEPARYDPKPMPLPADVPVERLPVGPLTCWRVRQRNMIRYLEERTPCIYLPNHDFRHSCVSPRLSSCVGIVGVVHGDDDSHYAHATRLGRYWNAVVAVSDVITGQVAALSPALVPRLVKISHGVEIAPHLPERRRMESAPLRIVYAGRLVQHLKRVMDLPLIIAALAERGVPSELMIVGSGMEGQQMVDACAGLGIQDRVRFLGTLSNERIYEVFEQCDVVILTSESEGMPVSLLEGMGRGCVPVVTDIRSGVPELVQDGVNGFRVPVGDIQRFAERLALLQRDVALRQAMSAEAFHTVDTGGYRVKDMVRRYLALFERVMGEIEVGRYRRPQGRIIPPPELTWWDRLPPLVQSAARCGKRVLLKQGG